MRRIPVFTLAVAATAAAAAPASAQLTDGHVTVQGVYARAVGEFRDHVRHGGGVEVGMTLPLSSRGNVGMTAVLGAIVYGTDRDEECLSVGAYSCRWHNVRTTSELGYFGIGPQLAVTLGVVTPYAGVVGGGSLFSTDSRVSDLFDPEYSAHINSHRSMTFSWSGGGGVLVNLTPNRHDIAILLDLGARYLGNGRSTFMRTEDAAGFPGGRTVSPVRSEANMLVFRLGFSATTGAGW